MIQQWIAAIILIVVLYIIAACGRSSSETAGVAASENTGGAALADCRLMDLAGNCRKPQPCIFDPAQTCLTAGAIDP